MKEYIQSIINQYGEQAAGKIAEDFQKFVEWLQSGESDFYPQINEQDEKSFWDYANQKYIYFNEVWTYFQDEGLNK